MLRRGLIAIAITLITLVLATPDAYGLAGYCVKMATSSCTYCGNLSTCSSRYPSVTTFTCPSGPSGNCYRCSIHVEGLLGGLGNVQPENGNPTSFKVVLFVDNEDPFSRQPTVSCVNPAGGTETAQGVPFITDPVVVSLTDVIDNNAQVSKNGRSLADIIFEDNELAQALIPLEPACNNNWNARVYIPSMQLHGLVYDNLNDSPTCHLDNPSTAAGCRLTDAMVVQCHAPPNTSALEPFDYQCTTLCSNKTAKPTTCDALYLSRGFLPQDVEDTYIDPTP